MISSRIGRALLVPSILVAALVATTNAWGQKLKLQPIGVLDFWW